MDDDAAPSAAMASGQPRSAQPVPQSTPLARLAQPTLRVLVADDHPINRHLTLLQLRALGHTAEAVANGREALAALERGPYDLVLLDCQMPELDGYATATEIRRRQQGAAQRSWVIALTAHAGGDRDRCLAAGMDDYLSKPLRLERLRATLQRYGPCG